MCQILKCSVLFLVVVLGAGSVLSYSLVGGNSNRNSRDFSANANSLKDTSGGSDPNFYYNSNNFKSLRGSDSNALKEGQVAGNELNSNFNAEDEGPKIGVYYKNYAGKIIKVIGEQNNSDSNHMVVTLPQLKVEDHIWDGKAIQLECTSNSYPVLWKYSGVGRPRVEVSTYRRASDISKVSSYSYGATVTFSHTDYRQTGEYTCHHVNQESHTGSSAFLFVPGKKIFVAIEDDEELHGVREVIADVNNPWVTLPCVPSTHDAGIILYSLSSDGTRGAKVELGESVTFDPTEGFRLKWKGINSVRNPWRNYLCVAKQGELPQGEELHLKLCPPQPNKKDGSNENSLADVELKFVAGREMIECCSSGGLTPTKGQSQGQTRPQMRLTSCVSMSDCYLATSLPTSTTTSDSDKKNKDNAFMVRLNDTCVGYELPEVNEAGVLECVSNERAPKRQLQFSFDPQTGLVTEFSADETETSKILSIGREKSNSGKDSANKNEAIYFCNSNAFFFSNGIKWAFIMRNQSTLQFLPEDKFPPRSNIVVDESQVREVYCFAPIWDSPTAWRNVSLTVPNPSN